MDNKKEIINKLTARVEKCNDKQMQEAIKRKIEILRDNKSVNK